MTKASQTAESREIEWLLREKYGGKATRGFRRDIERLRQGEPLAYVIGFVPFLRAHIGLSHHPLIPRPETEHWVLEAINEIRGSVMTRHCLILDLFSGSGAIGIALALHFPSADIYFGEKDTRLVRQIRKNLRANNIQKERTHVYASDVFSRIPHKKFNYIFANPPYVSRQRKSSVQKSVLKWEPREAIFAQDNGMRWIKKLIKEAPRYLEDSGMLFVECDPRQKKEIAQLARRTGFARVHFMQDQYKRWRVAVLTWNARPA